LFTPYLEFLRQDRTTLLNTHKRGLLHAVILNETDEVIGYKTYGIVYIDPCQRDYIDVTLTPLTTLNAEFYNALNFMPLKSATIQFIKNDPRYDSD